MASLNVCCTFPGKLGDNLARLPVARWLARHYRRNVYCAVDRQSEPFLDLLSDQPWVARAFSVDGIQHYSCGGQPWNFGEVGSRLESRYRIVHHLGYREFPVGSLTQRAADHTGFQFDATNFSLQVDCLDGTKAAEVSGPQLVLSAGCSEAHRYQQYRDAMLEVARLWCRRQEASSLHYTTFRLDDTLKVELESLGCTALDTLSLSRLISLQKNLQTRTITVDGFVWVCSRLTGCRTVVAMNSDPYFVGRCEGWNGEECVATTSEQLLHLSERLML